MSNDMPLRMVGFGWVMMAEKLSDSLAWNFKNPSVATFFLFRLQYALVEQELFGGICKVDIDIKCWWPLPAPPVTGGK